MNSAAGFIFPLLKLAFDPVLFSEDVAVSGAGRRIGLSLFEMIIFISASSLRGKRCAAHLGCAITIHLTAHYRLIEDHLSKLRSIFDSQERNFRHNVLKPASYEECSLSSSRNCSLLEKNLHKSSGHVHNFFSAPTLVRHSSSYSPLPF